MHLLSQEQVLEQEIKFLSMPGETLSSFYNHEAEQDLFMQPPLSVKKRLEKLHKLKNTKTSGKQPNSVFKILTYILLTTIIEQKAESGTLDKLKSTLYSNKLNLTQITQNPCGNLSNGVMKKILVELFQVMMYWNSNFEVMLRRYHIVQQIFTLYFRTILKSVGMEGSQNYMRGIDNLQAATKILDYFDISYGQHQNLIIFQNKRLSLYFDQETKQCFIGERFPQLDKSSDMSGQQKQTEDKQHEVPKYTPFFQCTSGFEDSEAQAKKAAEKASNYRMSYSKPVDQADEEDDENVFKNLNSLDKKMINYDSDAKKMKVIEKEQPNTSENTYSTPKEKYNRDEMFRNIQLNYASKTSRKNQQSMKASDIQNDQEENEQRKETLSERVGKRQKSLTDEQYDTQTKMSECYHRNPNNKIQSCVVQFKIQPNFQKRYKTTVQDHEDKSKFLKKPLTNNLQKDNKNSTKQKGSFPLFLAQRNQNFASRNSNSPFSQIPSHQNQQQQPQTEKKNLKVTFTYVSKTERSSNHVQTEPSRITYEPFCRHFEKATPQQYYPITQRSMISEKRNYVSSKSDWNRNFL